MNLIKLLFILVVFAACSHKEKVEWKELEEFHEVMAAVYHPLKDSGNLVPAKKRMKELAASAEMLAASEIPSSIHNNSLKELLEKLKADSKNLAAEIDNSASDDAIKEKLSSIHDEFHKIMEISEGEKEDHPEDEGEEDED